MGDSDQAILTGSYSSIGDKINSDLSTTLTPPSVPLSVSGDLPVISGNWTSQIRAGSQVYLNQKFGRDLSQHDLNLSKDRAKDIKKLMRSQCIYQSPEYINTAYIHSNEDYLDYFSMLESPEISNVGYDLIEKYKRGVGDKIIYWNNENGGQRTPFTTSSSPNSNQDILPILTGKESGTGVENWNHVFNSLYYPSPDQMKLHENIISLSPGSLMCKPIDRENPNLGCDTFNSLNMDSVENQYKCLNHGYGNKCRLNVDLSSAGAEGGPGVLTPDAPSSRNLQIEDSGSPNSRLSQYNNFKDVSDGLGDGLYGRWDSINNLCGTTPMKCSGTLKDAYRNYLGRPPFNTNPATECPTYFTNIINNGKLGEGADIVNKRTSYTELEKRKLCEKQFVNGMDLESATNSPLRNSSNSDTGCTYTSPPEFYTDLNLVDKCSIDDLYEKLQESGMRQVDLEKIEFTNGCNKRKIGYDIEHVCASPNGKYLSKSQTIESCINKKVNILNGNLETISPSPNSHDCGKNNSGPCDWIPVLKAKEYVDEDSQCNLRCKGGSIQNGSQPYCKSAPDYSDRNNNFEAGYLHPYLNPEWELNNFSCTAMDETKCSGSPDTRFKANIAWSESLNRFETTVEDCVSGGDGGGPGGPGEGGGPGPPPPTPGTKDFWPWVPGGWGAIAYTLVCIIAPFVIGRGSKPPAGAAAFDGKRATAAIIFMVVVGFILSLLVSNKIYSDYGGQYSGERYSHIFAYIVYSLIVVNNQAGGWSAPAAQPVSIGGLLRFLAVVFGGFVYIMLVSFQKDSPDTMGVIGLLSSVITIMVVMLHDWTNSMWKTIAMIVLLCIFAFINYHAETQSDGYINHEGFGLQEGFVTKPSECYAYSDCKLNNNCVWDEIISIIDGPQDYTTSFENRNMNLTPADEMIELMYGFVYLVHKYNDTPAGASQNIYFKNSQASTHSWSNLFKPVNTNKRFLKMTSFNNTSPYTINYLVDLYSGNGIYKWVESWDNIQDLLSDNSGNKKSMSSLTDQYNVDLPTIKKVFWYFWNVFHDGTNGKLRPEIMINSDGPGAPRIEETTSTHLSSATSVDDFGTNYSPTDPPTNYEIRRSIPLIKLIFKDWLNKNLEIQSKQGDESKKFNACEYSTLADKVCTYGHESNGICKESCDTDEILDYTAAQCISGDVDIWSSPPSTLMKHPDGQGGETLRSYHPNFQRFNCEFKKGSPAPGGVEGSENKYKKVGCIQNRLLNHNVIPGESCGDYLERAEAGGYNITCNDAVSRSEMGNYGKLTLLDRSKTCYTQFGVGNERASVNTKDKICGGSGGSDAAYEWISGNQIEVLDDSTLSTTTGEYIKRTGGISPVISCCAEKSESSASPECNAGSWVQVGTNGGYCSPSPSPTTFQSVESLPENLTAQEFCNAFPELDGDEGCT